MKTSRLSSAPYNPAMNKTLPSSNTFYKTYERQPINLENEHQVNENNSNKEHQEQQFGSKDNYHNFDSIIGQHRSSRVINNVNQKYSNG